MNCVSFVTRCFPPFASTALRSPRGVGMKFIWLRTRWQGHEPCCICGSVAEGRRAKGDGLNRCLYCWDRLRESEEEGNGKLNKAALATARLREQIKRRVLHSLQKDKYKIMVEGVWAQCPEGAEPVNEENVTQLLGQVVGDAESARTVVAWPPALSFTKLHATALTRPAHARIAAICPTCGRWILISGPYCWTLQRPTGSGPSAPERCTGPLRKGAKFGHIWAPGKPYCLQIECFECNCSDPNRAKDRDWQVFHGVQPQELSEDKERALAERLKREGHPGWPYQCY